MTNYHSFSKEEFENELPEGFDEVNVIRTKEFVYDYRLSDIFLIRIHSSVDKRSKMSRGCGDDAIRVSLYHEPSDSIIGYDSRTHRIMDENDKPMWPINMRKKIEKLMKEWEDEVYECPNCETGYLRKVEVNGGFYGCVNYPDCDFSTGMDEDGEPDLSIDFECPSCEDGYLRKIEANGSEFFGCSNYPECQFSCSIGGDGEPDYNGKDIEKAEKSKDWDKVKEFLKAKKDESDFYESLLESLNKYGRLTDRQFECIEDEVEIFHNGASSSDKFPLEDELTDEEDKLLKYFGLKGGERRF